MTLLGTLALVSWALFVVAIILAFTLVLVAWNETR